MANTDETKEEAVVLEQFKRNLSHIQIDTKKVGPEITIGDHVFKFKSKPPVSALSALIGNDNRVDGMSTYIKICLTEGQEDDFNALLEEIDIEGLSEILNALGEGYTSFPEKS